MAVLIQVGADSYISKLTLEAKATKEGEQSEMIRSLDKLVQIVGISDHSDWYCPCLYSSICLVTVRSKTSMQAMVAADHRYDPGRTVSAGQCGSGGQCHAAGAEKGSGSRYEDVSRHLPGLMCCVLIRPVQLPKIP